MGEILYTIVQRTAGKLDKVTKAIELLAGEVHEIRQAVVEHTATLDIILASQGGRMLYLYSNRFSGTFNITKNIRETNKQINVSDIFASPPISASAYSSD